MPAILNKDNPLRTARDCRIAEYAAAGMASHEIAAQPDINIKPRQVRTILSDDKIKAILDRTHRRYAAAASGIGKQFIKLCLDDDKSISTKNISEYHKIMGIAPSHTQSTFIQNIFNTLAVGELDPAVQNLLDYRNGMHSAREFTVDKNGEVVDG
uniref:Uncharacterized protein n=1 Tax=viral metagenome TaxID=1070528 RepID=A0A6M3INY8_9ZZZZ